MTEVAYCIPDKLGRRCVTHAMPLGDDEHCETGRKLLTPHRDIYMVHVTPTGAILVERYEDFRKLQGFSADWGKAWFAVVGTSIDDARETGATTASILSELSIDITKELIGGSSDGQ